MDVIFQRTAIGDGHSLTLRCIQSNQPGPHYDRSINFDTVKACRDALTAAGLPPQIADQDAFGPRVVTIEQLTEVGFPPPFPAS